MLAPVADSMTIAEGLPFVLGLGCAATQGCFSSRARDAGPGILAVRYAGQQPLFRERVPAQVERPPGGRRRAQAHLEAPVLDADQVTGPDRRPAAGVPTVAAVESVHRLGDDGPDPTLVADG